MKSGLTLIELVLAIFISSLISIGLYQMISQTQRGIGFITRIIESDTPIMPFYGQIEKDITGMFTPESSRQFYIDQDEKKESKQSEKAAKLKDEKSGEEKIEGKETEKQKKIDNVFYISKKEGGFVLSFITTGAIQPFSKKESVYNVPYIKRVAYILEKDPNNPKFLRIIYRYSTDNLNLDSILKPEFRPTYEIIGYIKNFSLDFVVFEYIEEDKEKKRQEPQQPKAVAIDQWNESEIWDKYKTLIPAYISIKGSMTDKIGKVDYPFEFEFKVFAYQEYKKQQKSVLERLDKWASEKLPQLLGGDKTDKALAANGIKQ